MCLTRNNCGTCVECSSQECVSAKKRMNKRENVHVTSNQDLKNILACCEINDGSSLLHGQLFHVAITDKWYMYNSTDDAFNETNITRGAKLVL